jgi:hypothetical protein
VEYEDLAPRLIEKMKTMGEWGEFFPARLSPYGYNETVAQEYFPLSEKDVLARGWNWKEEGAAAPSTGKSIAGEELPHDIRSVPDDVLEWTIRCAATGKPFRLTQQELTFHRSFNLPLPRCCFDERHRRRMQLRNPRKLWSRKCGKCQAPIQTSYAPEHLTIRGSEEPSGSRREIVVCEACYLKEVY